MSHPMRTFTSLPSSSGRSMFNKWFHSSVTLSFDTLTDGMLSLSITYTPCTETGCGWAWDDKEKLTRLTFWILASDPTVFRAVWCVSPPSRRWSAKARLIKVDSLSASRAAYALTTPQGPWIWTSRTYRRTFLRGWTLTWLMLLGTSDRSWREFALGTCGWVFSFRKVRDWTSMFSL